MPTRYVLFWFDVEDCSVTFTDDAAKRICQILTAHGVRGTMKVVGQKARVLRERVRYDVIDALDAHAIGFHSNWHGLRPQPAEYMAPLDWREGGLEFDRRERQGVDDLRDMWGHIPVCYGQPGSNWSPQVFPVLRKWGIPTYVSGFGYVGLHAQPFWYGGLLNTSHMFGADRQGEDARHAFGLNFELGEPGALEEHKRQFRQSHQALEQGGLISIMNHPCTLVLQRWFSTDIKSPAASEAGYRHFEDFVEFVLAHEDVRTITAEDLPVLYPDPCCNRVFALSEIERLAAGVVDKALFQELNGLSMSAAELFGLLVGAVTVAVQDRTGPGVVWRYFDGPAGPAVDSTSGLRVPLDQFVNAVAWVADFLERYERIPDAIPIGRVKVSPADFLGALARLMVNLEASPFQPDAASIEPTPNASADFVDLDAAHGAWRSSMMRPGFSAPKLLEQAKLQAWTLKPAILDANAQLTAGPGPRCGGSTNR